MLFKKKKMNITADDSSSDDEFSNILKSKKSDVPEEFSIDNLLKARVNENSSYNTPKREKKEEILTQSIVQKEDKKPIIILTDGTTTDDDLHDSANSFPIIDRDGSIFEFSQSSAAVEVFSLLEKDESSKDSESLFAQIIPLEKWQYISLQLHPNCVPISEQILYSILYHMIKNSDQEIGESIISYWDRFPESSIDYYVWYELIKKTINTKFFYGTIILLSISDLTKFKFEDEDQCDKAPFDVIALHFYSILCPEISENSNYRHVLSVFRKILNDSTSTFSEEQYEELIYACYTLASSCDPRNSSYLISLFPLDGLGCDLIVQVMMRLCLMCLRVYEFPDVITVEFIANSLTEIKHLCESLTTEDLLSASAAMALAERILTIAIKLKEVKGEVIETMSKNLKFSINCSNPGVLTALKEQIHVTRSQFDCFIQAGLV